MTAAPPWVLTGSTVFERVLRRVAAREGQDLVVRRGEGPRLLRAGDGAGIALHQDEEAPWAIAQWAVDALLDACHPRPHRAEVVALAPAAGVCGPAGAGPVDAVRILGTRTRGAPGHPVVTQVLQVQHTRCWLFGCAFLPAAGESLRLRYRPPVGLLDPTVSTDTARLTQFLHDRGLGADWPGILVPAPVPPASDGGLRFTAVCTEAEYAAGLLRRASTAEPLR